MNRAVLACAVMLLLATLSLAQKAVYTKAVLKELDCMGCAKKIAKKIQTVQGVKEVRVDLEARTLYIVHQPNVHPSAKLLWEAIEQADHEVEKLETPTESHTSKPKA